MRDSNPCCEALTAPFRETNWCKELFGAPIGGNYEENSIPKIDLSNSRGCFCDLRACC